MDETQAWTGMSVRACCSSPPLLLSRLVLTVGPSGCLAGMHRAEARHKEDVCNEIHEQTEVRGEGWGAERVPGAADHAGIGAPIPGEPVVSGEVANPLRVLSWHCQKGKDPGIWVYSLLNILFANKPLSIYFNSVLWLNKPELKTDFMCVCVFEDVFSRFHESGK